jgi:hypothetical protein
MHTRVLIVIPARPQAPAVHESTMRSVQALATGREADVLVIHGNGASGHYADLTAKLNRARLLAQEHYAGLFIVEADMLIPPDALDLLWTVDADIVYGTYCSRTMGHIILCAESMGVDRPVWLPLETIRLHWGQVIESAGVGFGCTLLRGAGLSIPLHSDHFGPDYYLSFDAQQAGLRQAHHLGVQCGHMIDGGGVLWPDLAEGYFVDEYPKILVYAVDNRYRILDGHRLWVSDSELLQPGEIIEFTPEQATGFLEKRIVEAA